MKKYFLQIIICYSLFIINLFCYSQHSKIDSLQTLLKKDKADTNKVNHLNKLFWEYKNTGNYDTALYYSNTALQIAEKINFKKGIATAYGNIGIVYRNQANYPKALDYYFKSLKIKEELEDKNGIAIQLGNIGIVYWNQADYPKALDYYLRALKMDEVLGRKSGIASDLGNIGIVYWNQGDYSKALDYFFKALKIKVELKDKNGIANTLGNIGLVFQNQHDYSKALDYYFKSLKIKEELGDKNGIAIHFSNIGSVYTKTGKFKEAEEYLNKASAIFDNIGAKNDLRQDEESLSQLYDTTRRYQLAFKHYKKAMALKDTIFSQENKKQLIRKEMNYEFEKKEAASKAEQEKKDVVQQAEKRQQTLVIKSLIIGVLLVLIFLVFVYRQRNRIAKEKKRSEELLLNILPSETARELKLTGHAEPKQFDMVTVLFTDFKGFTSIAEKMNAGELVSELNFLFSAFDKIISKYQIEKIKTIGDAYMCAGGLPVANTTNAMDVVLAALEIQEFCRTHSSPLLSGGGGGGPRIGIHTGPIVAGIVGIKKFAYDIWGDTVNTASRMESSGEAGKVNISGTTFSKLQTLKSLTGFQTLSELKFIYRGKIQAKHKGEIEMYFVEKI